MHTHIQESQDQWISKQLEKALQPSFLEVEDEGWQHVGHAEEGAGHFLIRIASPHFKGQSLLKCHQLVYAAVGDRIGKGIHALSIQIQDN